MPREQKTRKYQEDFVFIDKAKNHSKRIFAFVDEGQIKGIFG